MLLIPGSSPLARGLLADLEAAVGGEGIIPARAGFTSSPNRAPAAPRDHPRSRGVYLWVVDLQFSNWGSSPLARGLLRVHVVVVLGRRIIPARAGFTVDCDRGAVFVGDHPRSRGVYTASGRWAERRSGSSPLARGLRPVSEVELDGRGIIPARAGFTQQPRRRPRPQPDHPRSRGVYSLSERGSCAVHGSSPLARGLLKHLEQVQALHRIIPARAGFTLTAWPSGSPPRDHPRSRGVYVPARPADPLNNGSSPLARGLRRASRQRRKGHRIIPARAGFTLLDPARRSPTTDHPRSRGVYTCGSLESQR